MKKHYGPIVLGIIALTLAAPVSNATTVLAEETAGSESTTGSETETPSKETNKENTSEVTRSFKIPAYNVSTGEEIEISVEDQAFPKTGENEYQIDDSYVLLNPENDTDIISGNKITVNVSDKDDSVTVTDKTDTNNRIHVANKSDVISDSETAKKEADIYNNVIDNYTAKLDEYNGTNATLTGLKKNIPSKVESFSLFSDFQSKLDSINKKLTNLNNVVPSNNISTDIIKDGKSISVEAQNVPIVSGEETTDITIKDDDTPVGKINVDKNGKVTTSDSTLTLNTTKEPEFYASEAVLSNAENNIQELINFFNSFSTSNSKKLSNLTKQLESIKYTLRPYKGSPLNNEQVAEVINKANAYSDENKTTISQESGKNGRLDTIPLLKGATVYVRSVTPNEYIGITFNNDGKITSARITDANHNDINTSSVVKVKIDGSSDSPVTATGHKKSSNSSNTNKPETEKPATKPTHTKSISNHQTTFYALPNTIATLFDENGNTLKSRALGGDSSWYADKLMNLDGVNYLRVATNEWAKLADGLEVTPLDQNVFTKNDARLYQANGQKVTNRALAKNTAWRTDKSATINGQTMYRVATNEWVSANDLI
ncbi:SLAP domain-containing protein [Companilactobacillus farciminis]|uniref:SLAP domain-containing protein n=1 Tax=Companilactobacillus farciminis TaxID=1612 RepID=UPI00232B875A|nr:SLAP domain-containing protein [Companilactobacillus farciminis]WCG36089.1 SLAP domain-containing protein [Companilactobacillus farciminis]